MIFQRSGKRLSSLARASISQAFAGDALLKDISVTGCRLEHTALIDVKTGEKYQLTIKPESIAKIGEFTLTVEARWVQSANFNCEAGFLVVESPKGKLFQRYVDYLDFKSDGTGPSL
ncbi:MAG: hypothetical protein Ta2B_12740 [Termitinemataceae bacterium]|nr:MAG: hypothetical protein Ta2B_12740 [Termitinemataceae bacterium]